MTDEDVALALGTLFDIRRDVRLLVNELLEEDDDGPEEAQED